MNKSTDPQEKFSDLFAESIAEIDLSPGVIAKATIANINRKKGYVELDICSKSQGITLLTEFGDEEIAIGDEVDVYVESIDNGFGETRLSYEKAKRLRAWDDLQKIFESSELITGTILERVKGGFTVSLGAVRAFLPGSLVDVKPVRDPGHLEGKELEFKIIKMDVKRSNIVVSRRAVLQDETDAQGQSRLDELTEGQEIIGIVKNITDYGAFIDLGGVDGLLHITDMAWKRVKHPSQFLNVGDELKVKILKVDLDKNRVSLGLKQLGEDPWVNIAQRYSVDTRLQGRVTNVTDYGCFVELEEGVEGLVHMSEMDWTNKNIHPSKVVQVGNEIEVLVLEVDGDRRRISLGIKQCKENPWQEFSGQHKKGEKISGKIRSITDFGIFVGLSGSIDGLVHLSDISWTEPGEQAVRAFQKGDEVEAVILAIDSERERISLGLKQMQPAPLGDFIASHKDGVLTGKIVEVTADEATLEFDSGIKGQLAVADYADDTVKDLSQALKVDAELPVKIIGEDSAIGMLKLSNKALPAAKPAPRSAKKETPTKKATLGDLLKEHMDDEDKK